MWHLITTSRVLRMQLIRVDGSHGNARGRVPYLQLLIEGKGPGKGSLFLQEVACFLLARGFHFGMPFTIYLAPATLGHRLAAMHMNYSPVHSDFCGSCLPVGLDSAPRRGTGGPP